MLETSRQLLWIFGWQNKTHRKLLSASRKNINKGTDQEDPSDWMKHVKVSSGKNVHFSIIELAVDVLPVLDVLEIINDRMSFCCPLYKKKLRVLK